MLFPRWYLFGIIPMVKFIPEARPNPMTSLAKAVGPLDGRGNLPLYQELQRALRKAIDTRILGPDDALPSERDLAADFAVSRITVRKALDGLVSDGLLVRRQGSGNFVSARVDKNFAMLTSFSEDMRARGRTPRSVWLKRAAGTVTPEEALAVFELIDDLRDKVLALYRDQLQALLREQCANHHADDRDDAIDTHSF